MSWDAHQKMQQIEQRFGMHLTAAAIEVENEAKNSFGSSADYESDLQRETRLARGADSAATKKERAANRSAPWGPPNVDTGHLKANVTHDTPVGQPYIRRIGTGIGNADSVGYAMHLEFGTRWMLPRPWLRPALYKARAKIKFWLTRSVTS